MTLLTYLTSLELLWSGTLLGKERESVCVCGMYARIGEQKGEERLDGKGGKQIKV